MFKLLFRGFMFWMYLLNLKKMFFNRIKVGVYFLKKIKKGDFNYYV